MSIEEKAGRDGYTAFVRPNVGHIPPTPAVVAGGDSIVSGQNTWVIDGALQPRWRQSGASMANLGECLASEWSIGAVSPQGSAGSTLFLGASPWDNPTFGNQAGAVIVSGFSTQFNVISALTLNPGLFVSQASLISANGNSTLPSLRTMSNWFGANVYSAPRDVTMLVLSGNTGGRLFCFDGTATYNPPLLPITHFSPLTGGPSAYDIVTFDNRLVAWNCSSIGQRAQWCVAGDPEDWTGIGSGSEDLVDMQGAGTRIFVSNDELILASNAEIWRGRAIGEPYTFQFVPLERRLGMPFPRAALNTPLGIFWLGDQNMIYRLAGGQITPFGQPWQTYLQANNPAPDVAFFTFNNQLNHLRMYYSTTSTSYPTRSITFDFTTNNVYHETWGSVMQGGFSLPGTLANWLIAGRTPVVLNIPEAVVTSNGSTARLHPSATSDYGSIPTEEAMFAPLFTSNPEHHKYVQEVRMDARADATSSLSLAWVDDIGGHNSTGTHTFSISASSNFSQYKANFGVPARYPAMRLTSNDGGAWRIARYFVKAKPDGSQ